MSTPTVEPARTKKRPSPNDENIKPNIYATNLSPSKLLTSPLHSFKKIFWREEEEDETSLAVKKPKRDELLSPGSLNSGFITSSPNPKRPLAKAPQTPSVPSTKEAPVTPSNRRLSRNLAEEFEEASPSKSDTSLDAEIKKKTLLNTLFSPVFTLFNGKQSGSKSEKNSPSKNELSSDETLEPASSLVFQRELPEKINYDLYQQYGQYIVGIQEELCKEQVEATDEEIEYEDDDEYEEEDDLDFDPFQFIAQLPDVSELEKRPVLLPPKPKNGAKMTLVLDLDETLVHCSTEQLPGAELTFPVMYGGREYQVFVRRRPHFEEFLKRVSQLFEVVVFTASQEVYASRLLDLIDTENKYVHHRLYRDSCVCIEGNYLKDLSVLGRDLSRVVIVDNSPQAFGFQLENGIPIESWFEDAKDTELLKLIPFLESLLKVNDVRPLVREKFKLYEKVDVYKPNDGHH